MKHALLLVTILSCAVSPAFASERPNVIVILCDDIGAHELSLYGHPLHKTPPLDELGRTGVWFTTGCSSGLPWSFAKRHSRCFAKRIREFALTPIESVGVGTLGQIHPHRQSADQITATWLTVDHKGF